MNVAIVGSSGYIAEFLIKQLQKDERIGRIVGIDISENADYYLDLQNAEAFKYDCLNEIDVVIFTAATSGPDQCASDFERSWQINVVGTSYFIQEALKRNCKVLFFSSDAVFGDIPGCIYTEESETKANTAYGKMKKSIEDQFKEDLRFKAIRLSYVVSKKDRFVSYCMNCISKGEEADVFHPFYRNCITIKQLVKVVHWLLIHWEEYVPFVLNVAGDELVSRLRIADEINRCFENSLRYKITYPGDKFYENRPAITQMKSIYMEEYGILENKTFSEVFQNEMEES